MCNFQRGTYECRGDGYFLDADSDGFDPDDKSWPCPGCNTLEYLTIAKEESESCSFFVDCGDSGTGEDIWLRKLNWANGANPEETARVLKIIGPVHCLVHDKTSPDGFIVSINNT